MSANSGVIEERTTLALYGGPQPIGYLSDSQYLAALVSVFTPWPNRLTLVLPNGRIRKKRMSRSKLPELAESELLEASGVSFDNIEKTDFLNTNVTILFSRRDTVTIGMVSQPRRLFRRSEALSFLRLTLERLRPRYGFINTELGHQSDMYPYSGLASADSSMIKRTRNLKAFMDREMFLRGFVDDIYDVMVLGKAHTDRCWAGVPLLQWIQKSNTGSVTQINDELIFWEIGRENVAKVKTEAIMSHNVFQTYTNCT
jgi:hypothetical protein